ncbi:hypothetical protein pdam_00020510, partial [Pocillopora damicornis]
FWSAFSGTFCDLSNPTINAGIPNRLSKEYCSLFGRNNEGSHPNATVSSDSLTPHKDLNFGSWDRDPANCPLKRGGGWWYGRSSNCAVSSNLNGIYPHCRKETWADIFWKELDPNSPKGNAPTSTEMKIRPVDFL